MMMRLGLMVAVIAMGLAETSCSGHRSDSPSDAIPYKELLARNQAAISRLAVGMTKDEVMATMGTDSAVTKNGLVLNPIRTESFTIGADVFEKMFYVTSAHRMFGPVNESQTTPVVLKNGKVIGWGKDAVDQLERAPNLIIEERNR
jgi:hypothetical protein